jgi:hypothetical protein
MKRLVLSVCLLCAFFGCSTTTGSPKEELSKFLTAMQKSDFAEAKKYATDESQSFLDMINKGDGQSTNMYGNKTFTITNVEVNGDEAKAQVLFSSSSPVVFRLKQQHNTWKVNFNISALMDMLKDIMKIDGTDVEKDVHDALKSIDSIKINLDSLP